MTAPELPQFIKVLGQTWNVVGLEGELRDSDAWGKTVPRTQELQISTDGSLQRQQETLWHEVLHAIIIDRFKDELHVNEKQVTLLASILHQVFLDSPGLVEFLVAKEAVSDG